MYPRYLINTQTLQVEKQSIKAQGTESGKDDRLKYAILSHRWEDEEILFGETVSETTRGKPGVFKLEGAARKAKEENIKWLWVDTCCIDKRNSAEEAEAINSMFKWYRDAHVCYVYLHDVNRSQNPVPFSESEWFERGWTLQELLAPVDVRFYDANWDFLGTKIEKAVEISSITKIEREVLETQDFTKYSVAQRMSWAADRQTTRPEDLAYCLLGIFDVNMSPIYGEGITKAFTRLQGEIIQLIDDHSIFAWKMSAEIAFSGLLAPDPSCFRGCQAANLSGTRLGREPFSMTNRGLSVILYITPCGINTYLAYTDSIVGNKNVGIYLRRLDEDDQYVRVNLGKQGGLDFNHTFFSLNGCDPESDGLLIRQRRLYVRNGPYSARSGPQEVSGFQVSQQWVALESQGHVAFPEFPWHLLVFDLPNGQPFDRVALGIDFDLNPICILEDASWKEVGEGKSQLGEIMFADDFADYLETETGYTSRADPYEGLWCLRGDRCYGFDVVLINSPGGGRPIVRMDLISASGTDRCLWDIDIEDEMDD